MKTKVRRYYGIKHEIIDIYHLNCNTLNIIRLIDLFNVKYVLIFVKLEKNNVIFNQLEGDKIKIFSRNTKYGEIEILAPRDKLIEILNIIFEEDELDDFIIYDISDEYNDGLALSVFKGEETKGYCFWEKCRIAFEIEPDEYRIGIVLDKKQVDCKDAVKQIKNMNFI